MIYVSYGTCKPNRQNRHNIPSRVLPVTKHKSIVKAMNIFKKKNKISQIKLNPSDTNGRKNHSTFVLSKTCGSVVREPSEVATLTIT